MFLKIVVLCGLLKYNMSGFADWMFNIYIVSRLGLFV